ncbi:MAG: c-type cytochrome [Thiolinea sp.]
MQRHLITTILCAMAFGFSSGVLWAETGIDTVKTTLKPDDLNFVQNGRGIYEAQCAVCHGVELQGQADWETPDTTGRLPAPPHDQTGHTWHHSDDLLFEITKYGPAAAAEMPKYQSNMPVYENILSDDDIVAVLSYIKNSWPRQEREWQDALNGDQSQKTGIGGMGKGLLAQLTAKPQAKHSASADGGSAEKTPAEETGPIDIANHFAAALSNGDTEKLKILVADEASIFEEGSAQQSFVEYQRSHLAADIEFMADVERTVKDQQIIKQPELVVVLTQSELKGKAGSKIHMGVVETLVLQKTKASWKITHIHWSSKIL